MIEAAIAGSVILVAFLTVYKPSPRRILGIGLLALWRLTIGLLTLATIGHFDFSYRIPRATLLVTGAILFLIIPPWFVAIRRRLHPAGDRTVIVGTDRDEMADILGRTLGFVSPPSVSVRETDQYLTAPEMSVGGVPRSLGPLPHLGGLSRLDEVFVEHDVGTAVLAFAQPDCREFFGVLDAYYEHGVAAKVHREHADAVLASAVDRKLVEIELELAPWDWQDHIIKRLFHVGFAGNALLVLNPFMLIIAVALKLDSPVPHFYRQTRTAAFDSTFTITKLRSMVTGAEAGGDARLSDEDNGEENPRVTRVGRVLRWTHLDEIPQMWSVLRGRMSVVGPRPERPEVDEQIEHDVGLWRRRWIVKRVDGVVTDRRRDRVQPGVETPMRHRVHLQSIVLVRPEDSRPATPDRRRRPHDVRTQVSRMTQPLRPPVSVDDPPVRVPSNIRAGRQQHLNMTIQRHGLNVRSHTGWLGSKKW